MNGWQIMRIKMDDLEKYYNKPRESNGEFITKPQHERNSADPKLNCPVYEIRLPRFNTEKEAKRCFSRLVNFLTRNVHIGTVAVLGYSSHAKWTPYRYEQGAKGGRKRKIFNDSNSYKRSPHIHLNLAGSEAYRLATKLFTNESRLYKRKYGKPFPKIQRDFVRSKAGRNLSREYIAWQSTLYREVGSLDDFLKEHALEDGRNSNYYDDEY